MSYLRDPKLHQPDAVSRRQRLFDLHQQALSQELIGADLAEPELSTGDAERFLTRAHRSLGVETADRKLARAFRDQTSTRSSGMFG